MEIERITPNPPTNIVDFIGFASSIMLCLRGEILMSIGDFPDSLSQAVLVWIMLGGRLGSECTACSQETSAGARAGSSEHRHGPGPQLHYSILL